MEIVVVLGIVALMGVGTTALLQSLISLGKKSQIKAALFELKEQMIQVMKDDDSWQRTIASGTNPGLNCAMPTNLIGCATGTTVNNPRFFDRVGNIFYRGDVATAGWTYNGETCNTWSAAGNNSCPIRYDITLTFDCGTRNSPCRRPNVIVAGTLNFSPASLDTVTGTLNLGDFGINFQRKADVTLEPTVIIFQDEFPGGGAACADNPTNFCGGACTPGGWQVRKLNRVLKDQGQNINSVNFTANTFELKPGVYDCTIRASAFEATTGYKVRLLSQTSGASFDIGSGYSGTQTSTSTEGTVHMEFNGNETFVVEHYCSPGTIPSPFNMGIPALTYGATSGGLGHNVHTMIECINEN